MIHLTNQSGTPHATTATPAEATKPAESTRAAATHEEIERRAYDLYLKGGCKEGQCEENWRQAEQSMRDEGGASISTQACCGETPAANSLATVPTTTIPGKDLPRLSTVPVSPGAYDPKPRR